MSNNYKNTDDEVEGEIILPELPQEILNVIMYKFGGLQHPIAKIIHSTKKTIKRTWSPESNCFKVKGVNVLGFHKQIFLVLHFTKGYDIWYRDKNIIRLEAKENKLTYMGKKLRYARERTLDRKWVNDRSFTKHVIKEYLDENQIEYKKSWTKSKLIKQSLTF